MKAISGNENVFKLLKGGECYAPEKVGKKDILTIYNKIYKIEDSIPAEGFHDLDILDCSGKIVCPGFIDQHVHITGGGGEEGPASRIPELMLSSLVTAGVSTVVGVLGFDSITRNIASLLAKAKALQTEGMNTYIYTGSYGVPTATLTGKVVTDITFIDKVIGVGEIAIADYRSSHSTIEALRELAWEARAGGLIGDKAGIMHIHVGDGKEGLTSLIRLLEESDFPIDMFVPTHLNRTKKLFQQAIDYTLKGGNIDLTAGEITGKGISVADAIQMLLEKNADISKVTVSSDGNGSMPSPDGNGTVVGEVSKLYDDIKSCVFNNNIDFEVALKAVTLNVARILKIYPQKGVLKPGSDADILVLDKASLNIHDFLINGEYFISTGKVVRKGKYEK